VAFECDQIIQIDTIELYQIVTNLAVNARDAMKERGGIILISLKAATNVKACCVACTAIIEGDFIELSVSDNGTGIEPEIISQIFNPFFTTKKQSEGTGLGLFAVSGIVHRSGGHLLIDSNIDELNHGTTFRLLFPVFAEV
jgi:two-component system cell cycle sensor histidine kinase/response regulator CckA